jgi:hypothetical protein
MTADDVRSWPDAGGRFRPHFGDAVQLYRETGDAGPLDQYDRAHRAQEQRLRRATKRLGLRLRKSGSECSNICGVWDRDGVRVMFGTQNQVEAWLTAQS